MSRDQSYKTKIVSHLNKALVVVELRILCACRKNITWHKQASIHREDWTQNERPRHRTAELNARTAEIGYGFQKGTVRMTFWGVGSQPPLSQVGESGGAP